MIHIEIHKQHRQIFIVVDAVLTCAALPYIFLFTEFQYNFAIAIILMAVGFNGFALYSYNLIDQKRDILTMNEEWLKKWVIKRMGICIMEWGLYVSYVIKVGPPNCLEHWLLCTIGISLIAFGYYHLAEIEHEVGFEPPHKYITWMIPSRGPVLKDLPYMDR